MAEPLPKDGPHRLANWLPSATWDDLGNFLNVDLP
jgi:hypothetical protein